MGGGGDGEKEELFFLSSCLLVSLSPCRPPCLSCPPLLHSPTPHSLTSAIPDVQLSIF